VTRGEVLVVLSPTPTRFQPETILTVLDGALRGAGWPYRVFEVAPGPDVRSEIVREVKRSVANGCGRVVAVGGDGTVSMVAEGLVRCDDRAGPAVLGIIPAGTANVLARELGLPISLEAAVAAVIGNEETITLDAIRVGERFFLTQIGIGPDALMIRDTSREAQSRMGRAAYVVNFLRRAFRHRARRFEIEIDGSTFRAHAWEIVVANAGTLGSPPFTWGPRIDPADAVLDVCIYDVRGPADYARLAWRVLLGRHRKDANTRFLQVRDHVAIRSDRPVLIQADGEVLGSTPVTVQVAPGAVRVLVRRHVDAPANSAAPKESVAHDVETMLAMEHSRTWLLQGWLRHPVAALQALDAAFFLRWNTLSLGALADRIAWLISSTMRYGEGWVFVLCVMIAADFRTGLETAVDAVPVIGLTMLTVNYPLKRFFRRRRPFIAFVKARVFGTRPRDFSFPSGHAAAGFAGAAILGGHAPAFSPLFYTLAAIVSLSRVYLGVHYPSDVIFGAFLGSTLAVFYRFLLHAILPGLG
jgi:YegS/Rv2252/BmrU family lipid kinase